MLLNLLRTFSFGNFFRSAGYVYAESQVSITVGTSQCERMVEFAGLTFVSSLQVIFFIPHCMTCKQQTTGDDDRQ